MGKCVSKHPSAITIALSDKDLAGTTTTANQIWSKFAASSEYIALKDVYGNQLCEYYYVSNKVEDDSTTTTATRKEKNQTKKQNHQFATKIASNDDVVDDQADQEDFDSNSENENNIAAVAAPASMLLLHVKTDAGDDDTATAVDESTKYEYQPIWELRKEQKKNKSNQQKQHQQQKEDQLNIANSIVLPEIWCLQEQEQQQLLAEHNKIGDANNNNALVNDKKAAPSDSSNSFSKQKMINCKQKQKLSLSSSKASKNKCKKSNLKNKHHKTSLISTDNDDDAAAVVVIENVFDFQSDACQQIATNEIEDYRHSFDGTQKCFNFWHNEEGQTESKKLLKKHGVGNSGGVGAMETKGTAMSFGFRKKLLNSTPKKTKKQKEQDSANKKQDKCNNAISGDSETATDSESQKYNDRGVRSKTGGGGGTVIDTTQSMETNDNNGNTEQMSTVLFEKVGAVVAAKTAAAQTQHNSQGVSLIGEQQQTSHRPGAGNRFGFKGTSIVRPASTGITPRYQTDEQHANFENNNVNNGGGGMGNNNLPYKSNLKRRSKSAHSARSMTSNQGTGDSAELDGADADDAAPKIAQPKTITFNLNHNTIEYQRRQFFQQTPPPAVATTITSTTSAGRSMATPYNIINTGMHTNVIVRPTPRPQPTATTTVATAATTFTKFTLQTTSLPKPEYPVPIRLNTMPSNAHATTPITTTTSTSSPHATGARAKEHAVASSASTQVHHAHMDQKTAKQMANNTRRGFNGSREISADSGIASLDITLGGGGDSSTSSGGGGGGIGGSRSSTRHASPSKRSRSRPRNLQMVMNGRHKFEVRDLDDPLSSENSSLVEPLSLPKLPAENQTVPLPLSGLVRSNTVLSRESFIKSNTGSAAAGSSGSSTAKRDECDAATLTQPLTSLSRAQLSKQLSDDTDSIDEEKLHIDRSTSEKNSKKHHHFREINTYSSKTSSAGSSRASSWCNAGESLAMKDCSSLSISSSEDSNKLEHSHKINKQDNLTDTFNDDDLSTILNTDLQISSISSLTESLPAANALKDEISNVKPKCNQSLQLQKSGFSTTPMDNQKVERPQSLYSSMNESKFAEIAAAGSEFLLDDETSPTDSLVSSTDSDDAGCKKQKHKTNAEIQEKDIDEISPELEIGSPISPGTPTHASHSLSLSDCGNLIDDEIADQPALLFNNEGGADSCGGGADAAGTSHKSHVTSDTPTLMETGSMRSLKSQSKARTALQQAIELSLRTPISLRKAVMKRAESLDTLSPCESICSDDLMMDFDTNSSMDSIDKSVSIKSRSGSDLNKLDETTLFSELDRKGSDVMKELNTLMRAHTRNQDRESVIAHLPARATRLLNRSRLQQQCQLSNADSESPKSNHSVRRSTASRASTSSSLHHSSREVHSSSDDLMLYDKSFRNAMIQDVLQFKKQLLRLRRILQETETLNPFETDNGQLFASCGLDSKLLDDIDLASLTSSTTDDPLQELADIRRQVVYLQGQVDDRDRTIRLQRNLIEKLEAEKGKTIGIHSTDLEKECINMATQTERTRPLSIGTDGLSRSKPEYTSYTTYFPHLSSSEAVSILQQQQKQPALSATSNQTRRHTIISTTFTNYNQQQQPTKNTQRRASIAWENQQQQQQQQQQQSTILPATTTAYKPVKITLIGEPMKPLNGVELKKQQLNGGFKINGQQKNVADENMRNQRIGSYGDYNCNSNGYSKDMPQNGISNQQQKNTYQQQYEKYQQHKVSFNNNHNSNNNCSTAKCTTQQQQPTVTIV